MGILVRRPSELKYTALWGEDGGHRQTPRKDNGQITGIPRRRSGRRSKRAKKRPFPRSRRGTRRARACVSK